MSQLLPCFGSYNVTRREICAFDTICTLHTRTACTLYTGTVCTLHTSTVCRLHTRTVCTLHTRTVCTLRTRTFCTLRTRTFLRPAYLLLCSYFQIYISVHSSGLNED
jgi:hypothetical protein